MAYTSISITAPSSASPGERVSVTVTVKSIDPVYDHTIMTVASAPFPGDNIVYETELIRSGETRSYSAFFTMPSSDAIIRAGTYYPTGPPIEWHLDDYEERVVSLVAPPEVYAGTISGKELEYDESRADIPAHDIPQDKRGLVHVWGRNDMDSNQRMGISWIIKDPDGVVVEEYAYWEAFWTGPGREQPFIGDRFDINKPGTWLIGVGLYMNPKDPVMVDSYEGVLCTVAPEIYKATISKKELEYDETRSIIPVY